MTTINAPITILATEISAPISIGRYAISAPVAVGLVGPQGPQGDPGVFITVGPTAPEDPEPGDLWIVTDD